MLKSTFLHLKGVGKKSEFELWKKGVTTWDDYKNLTGEQLTIFDDQETEHALSESVRAYSSGDMAFFSECLTPVDYFRVVLSHDELDAITPAIVGLFYWVGMYEKYQSRKLSN